MSTSCASSPVPGRCATAPAHRRRRCTFRIRLDVAGAHHARAGKHGCRSGRADCVSRTVHRGGIVAHARILGIVADVLRDDDQDADKESAMQWLRSLRGQVPWPQMQGLYRAIVKISTHTGNVQRNQPPMSTVGQPITMVPPWAVESPMRAAGLPSAPGLKLTAVMKPDNSSTAYSAFRTGVSRGTPP